MATIICPSKGIPCNCNPNGLSSLENKYVICEDIEERLEDIANSDNADAEERFFTCIGNCNKHPIMPAMNAGVKAAMSWCRSIESAKAQEVLNETRSLHY